MKKRKPNFINKTTSALDHFVGGRGSSSKKTQKNQLSILGWIDNAARRHQFIVQPFQKDFVPSIYINKDELRKFDCKLHSIVRVSLQKLKGHAFDAKILEMYDSIDDPELEIAIAQQQHGFPISFSSESLEDAERARQLSPGRRRDLTHDLFVTIDGETARDFDDAISVHENKNGNFVLKVSIADVSHFIEEKSNLDKEAFDRGTSIYFPDRAIPMLPEILSTDLCSLVPHEDRLTITCEMEISPEGEILNSEIYPSVINSKARLTYTLAAKVIEEDEEAEVPKNIVKMLHSAHRLSLIVRNRRAEKGALDLDLPENQIQVNSQGDVIRIGLSERNEAHKLIEDFMILANEAVSERIEEAGYSSIFRVHEDPDPLKIDRLQKVVKHWGFQLSSKNEIVDAIQKFLTSVRGHPDEKILVVSLLRSLKQARYSATNAGHFGLGSESYCHFTSPIRRYPDLIIHRILRKSNFLKGRNEPYVFEKLEEIALQCSESERRAFLAERDVEDMKKTRFMAKYVGKSFEGVITSIKSFGLFVEILPHFVEGLIPIRMLPHDIWQVDELETRISGRRSRMEFWLGDRIRVSLTEVNRLRRQITFRYIGSTTSPGKSRK